MSEPDHSPVEQGELASSPEMAERSEEESYESEIEEEQQSQAEHQS